MESSRTRRIIERWFLGEPVLFQAVCTHEIKENARMECAARSGRGTIELNPDFVGNMTDRELEELLKVEVIRILLKHPYERIPDGCSRETASIASDVVLSDNYSFRYLSLASPSDLGLPSGYEYEWYARMLQGQGMGSTGTSGAGNGNGNGNGDGNGNSDGDGDDDGNGNGDGDGNGNGNGDGDGNGNGNGDGDENGNGDGNGKGEGKGVVNGNGNGGGDGKWIGNGDSKKGEWQARIDATALWEEDALMTEEINGIISGSTSWGTLPGGLIEKLRASTKTKIDWKNVLSGFRASILSSRRELTRMRPNRRYGFDQMGSKRIYDTKLLVAVDTSESISSECLSRFYSVINSAFKYGFQSIDVVQCDAQIHSVEKLSRKKTRFDASGRGGTSFQAPVDYAHKNAYDGLVYLTDGGAPAPKLPKGMTCKILWVCDTQQNYEVNKDWMRKIGRACVMKG